MEELLKLILAGGAVTVLILVSITILHIAIIVFYFRLCKDIRDIHNNQIDLEEKSEQQTKLTKELIHELKEIQFNQINENKILAMIYKKENDKFTESETLEKNLVE